MLNRIHKPIAAFLFGLAIVSPALLIIFVILRFGVDVPYWDDWVFVHLLEKVQMHRLSLGDFLSLHNEHRMVFPRLLKLGLAWLSGWNVFYELFASWVLVVLSFLILWDLLRITMGEQFQHKIKLLVVLNSILIFSLAQGENFIWGWQLQWFLADFFTIFSIWALARWKGRWTGVIAAALTTFAAQYSIASGQFLWFIGFAILLIERSTWNRAQKSFWCIFAAVSTSIYFYRFTDPDRQWLLIVERPFGFLQFVLASLGSPFGAFGPLGGFHASVLYGGMGLLLFIISTVLLWRHFYELWIKLLPWFQLAIYGLMSLAATAAGRMQNGIEYHSLVSRYSIFSLLFWIGALVFVVVSVDVLVQPGFSSRLRVQVPIALFWILLAWGHVNTSIGRYESLNEFTNRLHIAQSALYDYNRASDGDLKVTCFVEPKELRRRAALLETLRLGPYKNGTSKQIVAQLNQAWLEEIKRLHLVESEVPPNTIHVVPADIDAGRPEAKMLRFTVKNRSGVHCFLRGDAFGESNEDHPLRRRILAVQSNNASNIRVSWQDAKKNRESVSLYSIPFKNKWKLFRTQLPTDVHDYAVTLLYTDSPPIDDKLKLLLYDGR